MRSYTALLIDMKPMCCRTCPGCVATSCPATRAVPDVGLRTVQRMRMVVVLPAPLGPSRPKISPARASKLTWSTAWTRPRRRSRNDLVRFWTWIICLAGHRCRTALLSRRQSINVLVEHIALPGNVAGLADTLLDLLQGEV